MTSVGVMYRVAVVTSWLGIALVTLRLGDAIAVTPGLVVKTNTCQCNVTGQSNPCAVQEITDNHHRFTRSRDFPTSVTKLQVNTIIAIRDNKTVDFHMRWQGPAGAALQSTKGFILNLDLGVRGTQLLYIPVTGTPVRDANYQVTWYVQCELKSSTFKNTLIIKIYPAPLPLPENAPAMSKIQTMNIPAYSSIVAESLLTWRPQRTFNTVEGKPKFNLRFTIPPALQKDIDFLCIAFRPALLETACYPIIIKNGVCEYESPIVDPATCYNITLKIHAKRNSCHESWLFPDSGGHCMNLRPIRDINRLWNGSHCSPLSTKPLSTTTTPPSTATATTSAHESGSKFIPAVPLASTTEGAAVAPIIQPVSPNNEMALVAAIVPFTVLLSVAVVVVAFILKGRRMPDSGSLTSQVNVTSHEENEDGSQSGSSGLDVRTEISKYEMQYAKKVFILYSDDHEAHNEVIHQFATFLQAWCKCEVILDEWNMEDVSKDVFGWYLGQLNNVDKVIFVHSEGAYRKYQANIQKKKLIDRNLPPKGDPFIKVLQIVVQRIFTEDTTPPYLMTSFSYTNSEFFINDIRGCFMYRLPEHFQDLVLRIHDENKFKHGTKVCIERINGIDYQDTQEGSNLQHAIQLAKRFTEENPDWFNKRFTCTDVGQQIDCKPNSDVSDMLCTPIFPSKMNTDVLSLKPPDSKANSMVDIQDLDGHSPVSLTGPDDGNEDSPVTSMHLDSGLGTLSGTWEEVLGGIVNNISYANLPSAPMVMTDNCNGALEINLGNLSTHEEDSVGNYGVSSDRSNLVAMPGNAVDGYGNPIEHYANSMGDYGNSLSGDRNSMGENRNQASNRRYSIGDASMPFNEQCTFGCQRNPAGGPLVVDNANIASSYENSVHDNGGNAGFNGNGIMPEDYGLTPGYYGLTPSDLEIAPRDYRSSPVGGENEAGGYRDETGAATSRHSPVVELVDEFDFMPPESISSCSSSDINNGMEVYADQSRQEFDFTITDGIPDTKTDGFECSSV